MLEIIKKLTSLKRRNKVLVTMLIDSLAVIFILLLSFSIRLDRLYWPNDDIYWTIFAAPIIAIPIFYSFNLYKSILRYIGFKAILSIAQAVSLYSVVWGLTLFVVDIEFIPRSVIFINWMLCFILISGYRIFARVIFNEDFKVSYKSKTNILIYGAGSAGHQLSSSLQGSNEYINIAYIDDNKTLHGTYINGIKVYSFAKVADLINRKNISEIFLAIPSISKRKQKKIIETLSVMGVIVKKLPSVSDLATGAVEINDLRSIDVKDLLGRESVKPNKDLLEINITNKVVLVTGAGGSIGSELCRQIILLKPKVLILFDISESSLYEIDQELLILNLGNIRIYPILGSVGDRTSIKNLLLHYKVQTIYHAAAYKHVPLIEHNQSQGVLNNAIGTMVIALAAINANVETFVLISTDKAVRPTNTMGASKRVAELVLQALSKEHQETRLTMVRFGNVLESSGSVIPLFKKQIKNGGPITVTDVNIIRYFMTIPESVELVIQAGAMASGGEVFLLDMGKPVKIYDLAVKMIQLSGLQVLDDKNPDGDIEIKYTGLRPGEKLFEELLVGNNASLTNNKLIMRAKEEMLDWEDLKPLMKSLEDAAVNDNLQVVRDVLIKIAPEFKPNYPI